MRREPLRGLRPRSQHLHSDGVLTRHALSALLDSNIHLQEFHPMKRAALAVYVLGLFALFFSAHGPLNALTYPASEDSHTAPRNTLS